MSAKTSETSLDKIHLAVIRNIWLQRFTVFNRALLAAAFLPSGLKKAMGERFTMLPPDNPIGFFFEAFYRTGFYYNFIGWMQLLAAVLLLIPRTSTVGAVIFFPVVINICLITISVGFKGTWVITCLMVLANLYLLCWDYDKLKFILPFNIKAANNVISRRTFLLESVAWGILGTLGCAGLLMMNPIVTIPSLTVLVILALIGGAVFGIFAVWHRSRLGTGLGPGDEKTTCP